MEQNTNHGKTHVRCLVSRVGSKDEGGGHTGKVGIILVYGVMRDPSSAIWP